MQTTLDAFLAVPPQTARVGTANISYRRFGSGPPVLLVHGWPLNGATYRDLVAELAPHVTCIVPDLPGAGQSPWDDQMGNVFEGGGELIAGFVDTLGLDRVALVGHDSGGTIARVAAAKLGARVSALLLTNTELPDHVPGVVAAYQRMAHWPGATTFFRLALGWGPYRRSRWGLGSCFADPGRVDGEFHAACVVPMLEHMDNALLTLRRADFGYMRHLTALHQQIHAPVTCVWGAEDGFFPLADARPMLDTFPNPREFIAVDACGLLVHEEAPARVSEALLALMGVARSAPRPMVAAG